MEFQYKKALQEYNLTEAELPEDAKTGIMQINQMQKSINMLESNGKKPTKQTLAKIKTFDKWVYYEILDYVDGTDENSEEAPFQAEEIINEIKDKEQKLTKEQEYALEIEKELARMHQAGIKQWKSEDVEQFSEVIFEAVNKTYHQNDSENGIETTRYSLIETESQVFTIKKK